MMKNIPDLDNENLGRDNYQEINNEENQILTRSTRSMWTHFPNSKILIMKSLPKSIDLSIIPYYSFLRTPLITSVFSEIYVPYRKINHCIYTQTTCNYFLFSWFKLILSFPKIQDILEHFNWHNSLKSVGKYTNESVFK